MPYVANRHSGWKAVVCGASYSLALNEEPDGGLTLWAWGKNDHGQLGIGDRVNCDVPTLVGGEDDRWRAIAAGHSHSLALKEEPDGSLTLWAWGFDFCGQLGIGDPGIRVFPTLVCCDDDRWRAIAAGHSHSLALKEDGSLWAWGFNLFGQLGIGLTENQFKPIRVGWEYDWKAIAAKDFRSFATKDNGTIWEWGNGNKSTVPAQII